MSVKGSSEVNFQYGREFMRIDEVNDGDSSTHEDTEHPSNHDEPVAPAKVEHEDGLVRFNKPHPAHVSGEIVNVVAALGYFEAVVPVAQVLVVEDMAEIIVRHKFIFVPIRADDEVAFLFQALAQM